MTEPSQSRGIPKIADGPDTRHATPVGIPGSAFIPRRVMSAKAAEAAYEWEQLETSYAVACQERDEARNRVKLLEEANLMLHEELARAEKTAHFFEKLNTIIATRISDASLLIQSLQNLPLSPAEDPSKASEDPKALDKELDKLDSPPGSPSGSVSVTPHSFPHNSIFQEDKGPS